MKVNVPQHIFVRPSRSHLVSVVREIKEGLLGQPHELLYYCSCFSYRPWELRFPRGVVQDGFCVSAEARQGLV